MLKLAFLAGFLALALAQTNLSQATCPPECGCTSTGSVGCYLCLYKYSRTYHTATATCPCLTHYHEMLAVGSYCCSNNCSICASNGGCAACHDHWVLTPTNTSLMACLCASNYFFDGTKCQCLSVLSPSQYYWAAPEEACYECPPGCTCNLSGCAFCAQDSQRQVVSLSVNSTSKTKACPCLSPLKQISGLCGCPAGCTCPGRVISCDESSHYFLTRYGSMQCRAPYVEVNGACVCQQPYQTIATSMQVNVCLCGAVKSYSSVTKNNEGQCIACPLDCTCTEAGCISCNQATHRSTIGYSCPCILPFRQVSGSCLCYEPYYLSDNDTCACMDSIFPTLYYTDFVDGLSLNCLKCPLGCLCSAGGCLSCSAESLRIVSPMPEIRRSSCYWCVDNAIEVNGVCVCVDGTSPINGSCSCSTNGLYYYDDTALVCGLCPKDCLCSLQKGCYFCNSSSRRSVVLDDTTGKYTCKCQPWARIGDIENTCYCQQTADPLDASKCTCLSPYYADDTTEMCSCMSKQDPTTYYNNSFAQECTVCPDGCTCDSLGCSSCYSNTQRGIFLFTDRLLSSFSFCPCLQSTTPVDNLCNSCGPNHHFFNGECFECVNCTSCDWTGACTSCSSGLTLAHGTCECPIIGLININGSCRCPVGYYHNQITCVECPPFCLDCSPNTYNLSIIDCLICKQLTHRMDSPSQNCPCESGYAENPHGEKLAYCCENHCDTCNATGCTSCPSNLYRQVDNSSQKCTCMGTLVELSGSLACGCLAGQYRYDVYCRACPAQCQLCAWDVETQAVQCLSCPNNSNRNSSLGQNGTISCPCLPTFEEWSPRLSYCYPKHCSKAQTVCTACLNNRLPNSDGSGCQCQSNYFEDSNQQCQMCTMPGCLTCLTASFCTSCSTLAGYRLAGSTCYELLDHSHFIYAQSRDGILVQFNNEVDTLSFPMFVSVSAWLLNISSNIATSNTMGQSLELSTISVVPGSAVVEAHFSHPPQTMTGCLIMLNYTYRSRSAVSASSISYGVDAQGIYSQSTASINIEQPLIYSSELMSYSTKPQGQSQLMLVTLAMVLCLALYMKGYKHNQTVFFLQTLSFLGFTILDRSMKKAIYLSNLRYAYFDYGNPLASYIPNGYLESSYGNFAFFALDSNIVRVGGATLAVAFLVLVHSGLYRCMYFLCRRTSLRQNRQGQEIVKQLKKRIYRFLEFFYKCSAYPLIFFSLIGFNNWQPKVLAKNDDFHNVSKCICVATWAVYALITLFSVWLQDISRIQKLQNAMDFLSSCLASAILTFTIFSNTYLLLSTVFLLRMAAYLGVRKTFMRDFGFIEYMKIFTTSLEIATIALLQWDSVEAIAGFLVATLVAQLVHAVAVINITEQVVEIRSLNTESGESTEVQLPNTKSQVNVY